MHRMAPVVRVLAPGYPAMGPREPPRHRRVVSPRVSGEELQLAMRNPMAKQAAIGDTMVPLPSTKAPPALSSGAPFRYLRPWHVGSGQQMMGRGEVQRMEVRQGDHVSSLHSSP